jgi:hypothetical protein
VPRRIKSFASIITVKGNHPCKEETSNQMSVETPDGSDITMSSSMAHPSLKRTLKDLLVQDEVSDSDVEMIEKQTPDEEPEEAIDPDMCVECGDQA